MPLDRETVMQVGLSTVAVVLFIVGAVVVSLNYRTNGTLTEQGGIALVAAIGVFVVLMLGVGLWLERQDF